VRLGDAVPLDPPDPDLRSKYSALCIIYRNVWSGGAPEAEQVCSSKV
jgi:hypothetical protein